MTAGEDGSSRKVYRGVWAVLAGLFRVPQRPPTLLAPRGESTESFRPSPGFLDYLKLQFWIALLGVDLGLFVLWVIVLIREPLAGILLAPLFLIVMVVPDIVAYVAIHLRYDTTWYVLSSSSMRIRRGIWIIRETTVTFENVQNVEIKQGPLQRHFGVANLIVQTAGGSGASPQRGQTNPHLGLIEGIDDANRVRDLIMNRVRRSRRAGLGDEHPDEDLGRGRGPGWTPAHLEALRAIRSEISALR